ncbi:hypothetical protein Tco_0367870 [Tanacetum coccineum]
MTKAQDQRLHSMKEQAYNIIKTKDSRTQQQSNLKKFKEARFKISPQEFEDHTLGEIVSLNYVGDVSSYDQHIQLLRLHAFTNDMYSCSTMPSTRKEKDLCIHGPHQLPNSKGNIQFTPDAIEYPSAIINVASTPDSVQTSSTGGTITPNVYHKKKQLANYHIHQPQPDGRHQSLFNKVTGTPNHKTIRPGSQTVGKILFLLSTTANHSDIHNASSTDLSAPSSMATILRIQPEQLYPHVFKQIPMNKGNIQVTPDAIQSPPARVTIPKHNHAA